MGSLFEWITDWIKEGLIDAITGQYTSIFNSVNNQVADVANQVGQTPQGWNGGVFSMIQNLSETVVIPIAGMILTFVLVYELMLNQAQGDRQILAKQLGISPHQLSYVTHSGPGEGLLFFGNVIIPFVDHFPKDTLLYSVLTTRPDEIAGTKA